MSACERAKPDENVRQAGKVCSSERDRRAVTAYAEAGDEEASELPVLLKMMASTHAETLRRLESAQRKLDDTLARLNRPRLLS